MTNANDRPTSALSGVQRWAAAAHPDGRGSFRELWRQSWTAGLQPFRQANLSRSNPGVLRGMHFHERQTDLWAILGGRVFVALADLRSMVAGDDPAPLLDTFELAAGSSVLIPEGVAHGLYTFEEVALLYLVTNEYDASDEWGFAWDDPLAAIPWPDQRPTLSERDRTNPPLRAAVEAARQRAGQSASR